MFSDGDRCCMRALAAVGSIQHPELCEGKRGQPSPQNPAFYVCPLPGTVGTIVPLSGPSRCASPSSVHKKIITLAGEHLIKFHCICFGSHSVENLLLTSNVGSDKAKLPVTELWAIPSLLPMRVPFPFPIQAPAAPWPCSAHGRCSRTPHPHPHMVPPAHSSLSPDSQTCHFKLTPIMAYFHHALPTHPRQSITWVQNRG